MLNMIEYTWIDLNKRVLNKLHVFFISNSFLGVNVRVAQQIYVSKAKSCLGVAKQFPKFLTIFSNFLIVTWIYPKYYCTQLRCIKTIVEKFSFSELKIEKAKFFTQSSIKFFLQERF